jgi:thioesterase domain-containing protein
VLESPDVVGLIHRLADLLAADGPPPLAAPPRAATSPHLVALQEHGSRPPFFCIAPVLGVAAPYLALARQLGPRQPFYGLQPRGIDGAHAPRSSVPAMAADYVEAIRELQPSGPYFVGGWSFGGIVAYELARQLVAQKERVGLLAVIDMASPSTKASLWSAVRFFATIGGPGTRLFLPDYLRLRFGVGRRLASSRPPGLRTLYDVLIANVEAGYAYEAGAYAGDLTLFRTARGQRRPSDADPTWGWGDLVRGTIAVQYVPGGHMTLMRPPHVQRLAHALRGCLEAAQATPPAAYGRAPGPPRGPAPARSACPPLAARTTLA